MFLRDSLHFLPQCDLEKHISASLKLIYKYVSKNLLQIKLHKIINKPSMAYNSFLLMKAKINSLTIMNFSLPTVYLGIN